MPAEKQPYLDRIASSGSTTVRPFIRDILFIRDDNGLMTVHVSQILAEGRTYNGCECPSAASVQEPLQATVRRHSNLRRLIFYNVPSDHSGCRNCWIDPGTGAEIGRFDVLLSAISSRTHR
jgi:hypothetical protein